MKTKTIHIVNGDCLAGSLLSYFSRTQIIVCRECLIVGNVKEKNLTRFWNERAKFISETYSDTIDNYYKIVVDELCKIDELETNQEVNLWFEDDLFCQVNMWFVLSVLSRRNFSRIYRVFPSINPVHSFNGFDEMDEDKVYSLIQNRIIFRPSDLNLGFLLWEAYQEHNLSQLKKLSELLSPCFRNLDKVCQAHIDRFEHIGRPEKSLLKVMEAGNTDFEDVFNKFKEEESIYGFGDMQIKHLYEKVLNSKE